MKIQRIKVGNELCDIEPMIISTTEPTGDDRLNCWLKPKVVTVCSDMTYSTGEADASGIMHCFVLDDNGNIVEDSNSSHTYHLMDPVTIKPNVLYSLQHYGEGGLDGSTDKTIGIAYFDSEDNFISKVSVDAKAFASYSFPDVQLVSPSNATTARILMPNGDFSPLESNICLVEGDTKYEDHGIYQLINNVYYRIL